jgi:hypothetical protein
MKRVAGSPGKNFASCSAHPRSSAISDIPVVYLTPMKRVAAESQFLLIQIHAQRATGTYRPNGEFARRAPKYKFVEGPGDVEERMRLKKFPNWKSWRESHPETFMSHHNLRILIRFLGLLRRLSFPPSGSRGPFPAGQRRLLAGYCIASISGTRSLG